MKKENIEQKSEVLLLGNLVKSPDKVFDICGIIKESDFLYTSTQCIFSAIRSLAEENTIYENNEINKDILKQKISIIFPDIFASKQSNFARTIDNIYKTETLSNKDIKSTISFILKNSTEKKALKTLRAVRKEILQKNSHQEILSCLEKSIFDFTSSAVQESDIVVLGEEYAQQLAIREQLAKEGNLQVGINTGFPNYDMCIGGGLRNGTINVIAARPKRGKSFLGLKIADNVASNNIPVLYMDTELQDNHQSDRRCCQHTGVPLNIIEEARWADFPEYKEKLFDFFDYNNKHPIYYVDIKGWSIERQISVIRKFFARYVGKNQFGKYNPGLVVLDYLKLMRAGEKGFDKEWETLGYRMTILHDLMAEYNNPMLALAQQNRDGLDKEDESTISGSDRIIWLCDSFSILSTFNETEMMAREEGAGLNNRIANTKLNVVVTRYGPGTPGSYIALYFDIRNRKLQFNQIAGIIQEMGREVIVGNAA